MASPLTRLGDSLRLLRKERGLRIDELASLAGVEPGLLREVESSGGTAPLHLAHLDRILAAAGVSLRELANAEQRILIDREHPPKPEEDQTDAMLRTIESLQDRVDALEEELETRTSATMRSFQMQTIKLLEKTMETSGMSHEDMRRLVSDMRVEDVS